MFRKVRDDVLSLTDRKQLPSVYGSLPHKPIYLKRRSISVQPMDGANPAMRSDEAIWLTIKDSTDKNLFTEFVNRFPFSPYVREAGALVVASRETVALAGIAGGPDECDRLAASPLACDDAMRRASREARFPFEAARVEVARSDYAVARELYEKASELGSSLAMYSLGLLDVEGKMGPADYAEARRWYAKAVALNAAFAMPELAALYEKGLGGPKDAAGAVRLTGRRQPQVIR